MNLLLSRRRLLRNSLLTVSGSLLAACSSSPTKPPSTSISSKTTTQSPAIAPNHIVKPTPSTVSTLPNSMNNNTLRIFASSGFAEDNSRIETAFNRLTNAGFTVSNQTAAYRRFQRFAGSDAERIADFQDIATGRVPTPKVLMGLRGGYGAVRLLPKIDWDRLSAKMREQQTLLFGFSDVTAIQLALMSQGGGMPSFAGPMLYGDFSKNPPNSYTMDSFIQTTTHNQTTIVVSEFQSQPVRNIDGILWGGNLSVLASLAGSPYIPQIKGGILFLEDVAEQPYRIERMFYTLLLAGILKNQQAIVLGDFRMGNLRDSYDNSYNLSSIANSIARAVNIPVYTGFPFGHISNKNTFPLGAYAQLRPNNGGYQITFSGYPTLNTTTLNLNSLMFPTPNSTLVDDTNNDYAD